MLETGSISRGGFNFGARFQGEGSISQDSQTLVDELMAKTKIFFFLAALMIAEAWDVSLCTLSFELEFNGRLKLGVMTSVGQVAN